MDPLIMAVLAAFVPALGWLVYFYRRDRFEPEPHRVVLAFFARGALLGVPAAVILSFVTVPLVERAGVDASGLLGVFVVMFLLAGLPEEAIKGALGAHRARREPSVDEPADPMIYFTSLGLGFGALETVTYLLVFPDFFVETAIVRALTVTAGHGLWTGITGYFWGSRRFGLGARSGLVGGILIAALAHALYNTAVGVNLFLGVAVLLVSALVWGALLRNALSRSPHAMVMGA